MPNCKAMQTYNTVSSHNPQPQPATPSISASPSSQPSTNPIQLAPETSTKIEDEQLMAMAMTMILQHATAVTAKERFFRHGQRESVYPTHPGFRRHYAYDEASLLASQRLLFDAYPALHPLLRRQCHHASTGGGGVPQFIAKCDPHAYQNCNISTTNISVYIRACGLETG